MNGKIERTGDTIFCKAGIFSSALIFILTATTPSAIVERVIWIYSTAKFYMVLFTFIIFVLAIVIFLFYKTRFFTKVINLYLSSKPIHIFAIITSIAMVVLIICSFLDIFGDFNPIISHLSLIWLLILLFSIDTLAAQIIQTKGAIGGRFWKNITSLEFGRESKILLFALLLTLGFFSATAVNYYRGIYLKLPYPYNSFLFGAIDRFSDFYQVVRETIGMDPYGTWKSGQYPFLLFFSSIFSRINENYSYLFFILGFLIIYYGFNYYFLRLKPILLSFLSAFIISTFSYPLLMSLDRGNFEMLVYVFLLLFIFMFYKKRFIYAAIFLGFATALKIYPAIFLFLFVKEKKYKEILVFFGLFFTLSIISLMSFNDGLWKNLEYLLNFSNISNNELFLSFTSIEKGTLVQRGVALFTLIKILIQQYNIPLSMGIEQNISIIYFGLVFVIFLPTAYTVLFIENELWKNVAMLTICMLILPTISADYKLLHLYLPLFLYINTKQKSKLDITYCVLFAFLFIPKNYFFLSRVISDSGINTDICLAVPLNILVLLILLLVLQISCMISRKKLH